ncbi:MAG: phospholipid-binding protein MlaC [Nitrospinota bacterium]
MKGRRIRMKMLAALLGWVLAVGVFGGATVSLAREPKDELKETIDRVLGVLKDPAYKGDGRLKARRQKLREIINPRFDYKEMAKRSLARHWRRRTPKERKDFVNIFADLLERSYVSKIEAYTDEKIIYPSQRVEERYAEVRTKIVPPSGRDIPIDYRLHKTPTGWRVYDVIIEGVSLVSNYRGQFNRIIRRDSYARLIRRMKSKQKDMKKGEL